MSHNASFSSRSRFMVETLTNLKNNRIKKPAAGQHAGGDALERLKKFLSGLSKKRQGKPPNIFPQLFPLLINLIHSSSPRASSHHAQRPSFRREQGKMVARRRCMGRRPPRRTSGERCCAPASFWKSEREHADAACKEARHEHGDPAESFCRAHE